MAKTKFSLPVTVRLSSTKMGIKTVEILLKESEIYIDKQTFWIYNVSDKRKNMKDIEIYQQIIKNNFTPEHLKNLPREEIFTEQTFEELLKTWDGRFSICKQELFDRVYLFSAYYVAQLFASENVVGEFEDALQDTWMTIRTIKKPTNADFNIFKKNLETLLEKSHKNQRQKAQKANLDLNFPHVENLNNVEEEIPSAFDADTKILKADLKDHMICQLNTLKPQEKEVLKIRYWAQSSLKDTGERISLSGERCRKIEAKALCKLRHPSRSKHLKDFIDLY